MVLYLVIKFHEENNTALSTRNKILNKKLEEKEAEEVSKVNKEESSDESVNESNAPLRDEDISLKKLKKLSGKKKK